MTFFNQLREACTDAQTNLRTAPIISAALQGEVTRAQYIAFLTQAYHHVQHTVPLLMACGARLPARLEWLRAAVAHYIDEEIGHHEWILDDIAAAGGDPASVRHGAPAYATELMISYAYDTVARHNPVGFFGMVYVLEGTSVLLATQVANALQHALDLPQQAFTYLTSHGSLDLQHIEDFEALMNRLDDAADQAAVIHRARNFFRLYAEVINTSHIETIKCQ